MAWTFRHFAAKSRTALALFDVEGRLAYANRAFAALAPGCDALALVGRDLDRLPLSAPLKEGLAASLPRAGRDGGGFSWEEGSEVDLRRYRCTVIPLPGDDGIVVEIAEEPVAERLKQALAAERLVRRR
ncbi:MAG: hypothetical protein GYA47_01215, partial [Desulfovibrio sp.]|nr:hypothetical protein [Desulfovibrio sp.]